MTDLALVSEDVDNCDVPEFEEFRNCYDGYERFGGATSFLTTGPTDPHVGDIRLDATSRDASKAFWTTTTPLVAEDTNGVRDVYQRSNGTTTLVSVGPLGQAPSGSTFFGLSEDGSRVFFRTSSPLVPEDEDSCPDFYERAAGTTTLVSTGVPPGDHFPACSSISWVGSSADGTRVFLDSDGQVTSEDTDDDRDIYEWSNGEASLISTGPADSPAGGILAPDPTISRDGEHVFFRTTEQLVAQDTDSESDLYEHFAGTTSLVVPPAGADTSPVGFFNNMSEDSSHVFISTTASLVPEDTDGGQDVYERFDEDFILVSTGHLGSAGTAHVPGPSPFGGVSADGQAVLFASSAPFVPEDTDSVQDIYLRTDGQTTLVSTGPSDAHQAFPARSDLVILSPDGTRAFFQTSGQLVPEDTDAYIDVYEWHAGRTTLVPHGVPTPDHVGLDGVAAKAIVADGSRVFIGTNLSLTPNDTDNESDLYAVDISNAYPRPKGATPVHFSLVPAYAPCASPNRQHGPPLAFPSCNPPAQTSDELTVGSADANGKPTRSISDLRFKTLPGVPSTPADEADVQLDARVTDVYNQGTTLTDYAGELRAQTSLRITDKLNTPHPGGPGAGTVSDISFGFTIPCAPSADPNEGGSCALNTTADALFPGALVEGRRAIWQLGALQVYDGGADDDGDTPGDNTLFMKQGIFVP